MLKNIADNAKTPIEMIMKGLFFKLSLPFLLFLLLILTILAPLLLLFMGNDTGSLCPVTYDGIQGNFSNDLQGWANFLDAKHENLMEKIQKRSCGQPDTRDKQGNPLGSYTNVTKHYYTNGGQVSYATNNMKEILSMAMVYFGQDYSDGAAVFQYIDQLFNASCHVTYKESPLYGSKEGCEKRTYSCSDSLEGIYNNCFFIPEEKAAREKQHRLYLSQGGCQEHYEDKIFYYHNGSGTDKFSQRQCTENPCPGHTEHAPGSCLGNHVEKICYGHVDLEASVRIDSFPEIYNNDSIGNLSGNAKPGESLGIFQVTAYCPCQKCCGKYANGITASGTVATEGRTIAVDPDKIPYGTRIVMNGHTYVAEECGSGVNGNHIDLFMSSHEKALQWGLKHLEVFYETEETKVTEDIQEPDGKKTETYIQEEVFIFCGWDEDAREWVDCLYDMDWEELYGIQILQGNAESLPDSDFGDFLENLPEGTDKIRQKIVETALSMAGKIPYCWGGTAQGPGVSGIPSAGLDCSHFVDWVYWTAIGNNLGNGNTETLWGISQSISQGQLKPGDLGFRYVPAGYGGPGGTPGHTNHVGIYAGKDGAGNEIWVHENGTADNVSVGIYHGFTYYRRILNDES